MNNEPLISVVTPTHNRPELLQEAITSVIKQDYTNWEHIIVDDASSPPARLADQFESHSDRIRIIRHDNAQGGAAAKNTGIAAARGEQIAFLDDDDLYHPNYLRTANDFLTQHNSINLLFMGVSWFGSAANWGENAQRAALDKIMRVANSSILNDDFVLFEKSLLDALLDTVPMAFQRPVVRRATLDLIGRYREDCLLWDCDWALRAIIKEQAALCMIPLYLQRADSQGLSSQPSRVIEHMRSNINIKEQLYLSLRGGDLDNTLMVKKIRHATAKSWFDLAYFYYNNGATAESFSALFKSQKWHIAPGRAKLAVRLLLKSLNNNVPKPSKP